MQELPLQIQAPLRQLPGAGAWQVGMLERYLTPLPNAAFSHLLIK